MRYVSSELTGHLSALVGPLQVSEVGYSRERGDATSGEEESKQCNKQDRGRGRGEGGGGALCTNCNQTSDD
jgi:hypothetical protein